MITSENTKTIYDLVQNAGREYGDATFLRYEDNDVIYDVSFAQFAAQCQSIASWVRAQGLEEKSMSLCSAPAATTIWRFF